MAKQKKIARRATARAPEAASISFQVPLRKLGGGVAGRFLLTAEQPSTDEGRTGLLNAASQFEPDLLASLLAGPLRAYRSCVRPAGHGLTAGPLSWGLALGLVDFRPLRRELRAWAKRWHLGADWCFDHSLFTLWRQADNHPPEPGFEYAGLLHPPGSGAAVVPAPRRRARHVQPRTHKKLAETGPGRAADARFFWLAAYQASGLSFYGIAKLAQTSPQAVRDGVQRLAEQLGLSLRVTSGRGRAATATQATMLRPRPRV
jgi:hypothetical protein